MKDVVTALKRGADGYLLKDMEPEDLLKALQQAAAGEMVLSEALTPVLAASLRANRATSDRDISQLTPRERDSQADSRGLPNKMIARRRISPKAPSKYVKHMLKKMKLKSRVEAAVWVHRANLLRRVRPRRGVVNLTSGSVNAGRSHWRRRAAPVYPPPPPTGASGSRRPVHCSTPA